jgi:hypothetical protein
MGAFAELRAWLRGASTSSRGLAAIGGALGLALLGWLLVPPGDEAPRGATSVNAGAPTASTIASPSDQSPNDDVAAGPGAAHGGNGSAAPSSGAPTPVRGGQAPSSATPTPARGGPAPSSGTPTPARGGPAPSSACASPPGASPGITGSEIKIAIGNTEIVGPAANGLFGIPPSEYLRSEYDAVIDSINRSGGVACRKLVAQYYKINPSDQSAMQQQCRDIADSGVYAVLDDGGWASVSTATVTCFAQRKILYLGAYFLGRALVERLYPYVFSFYNYEELYRNTAFALRDRGFFQASNGFAKLGFLYRDCYKDSVESFVGSLHDAGIPDNKIVRYSLGCPSVFATPADIQQAVLTFRREGVTHLTAAFALGDFGNFTKVAQQQGFRPKYGLPDETLIPISYGSMRADPQNIAGAIAISVSRNGEEHTPGFAPSPGSARCNQIMKSHGLKSVYEEPTGAGNACSLLWVLQAGMQHAAKSIDVSYPQGPNDLSRPRTMTGGQFWRPAQYFVECECWRVIDPNFKPSYR